MVDSLGVKEVENKKKKKEQSLSEPSSAINSTPKKKRKENQPELSIKGGFRNPSLSNDSSFHNRCNVSLQSKGPPYTPSPAAHQLFKHIFEHKSPNVNVQVYDIEPSTTLSVPPKTSWNEKITSQALRCVLLLGSAFSTVLLGHDGYPFSHFTPCISCLPVA